MNYHPPIYRRKTNDWIKSIQIDHIVVGPTGLYLIETKNWSKESTQNTDFYSPSEQLRRSAHAIFCELSDPSNAYKFYSFQTYDGMQKISAKQILLMVGNGSYDDVDFVRVCSLDTVNPYITYGREVFSPEQMKELVEFFNRNDLCAYPHSQDYRIPQTVFRHGI
jgi:hypothetical protein